MQLTQHPPQDGRTDPADPPSACSKMSCVSCARAGETDLSSSTDMAAVAAKVCCGECLRAIGNDLCVPAAALFYMIVKTTITTSFAMSWRF